MVDVSDCNNMSNKLNAVPLTLDFDQDAKLLLL
jgi:hypothetical protein